jgi:uncharacterized protein
MQMKKYTRALITGASSGIGLSLAQQLAQQGTHLILVARRTERLLEISQELKKQHSIQVDILTVDLSDATQINQIIQFCEAQNYSVDLLINNAGLGPYKKFTQSSLETHLAVNQVNSLAPLTLCYQFVPHMLKHKKQSSILNVASVAGVIPVSGFAVYSATKSFLSSFSNVLSYELKDSNIHVSCLYPGATATEFSEKNNQVVIGSKIFFMSSEAVAHAALKGVSHNRMIIIPGFLNKLQIVLSRLIPTKVLLKLSSFAMSTAVKEQ